MKKRPGLRHEHPFTTQASQVQILTDLHLNSPVCTKGAAPSEWVAHCDQAGRQEGVKEGYFLARCGFIKELIYLGMWSLGD